MQFDLANKDEVKTYGKLIQVRLVKAALVAARAFYQFQVPNSEGYHNNTVPLWTGYFRANWRVSVDRPDLSVVPGVRYRDEKYGAENIETERLLDETWGADDSGASTAGKEKFVGDIDTGRTTRLEYRQDAILELFMSKNKSIFVTNNTWYANWLNEGGVDSDYGIETYKRKWKASFMLERGSERAFDRVHHFMQTEMWRVTRREANYLQDKKV